MPNLSLSDLEYKFESFFAKFPRLPQDLQNLIVTYGCYLCLIGGVVTILNSGILSMYSGGFLTSFGKALNPIFVASMIWSIIMGIVLISSFAPLKNRQKRGWLTLFYYALLYGGVSFVLLDLVATAMSLVLLYILFQIKSSYN